MGFEPPVRRGVIDRMGLVKHLTATEHGWFLNTFGGLPDPSPYGDNPDADFRVGPDETADGLVSTYVQTCQRARELASGADLDAAIHLGSGQSVNLRAIMLHMI